MQLRRALGSLTLLLLSALVGASFAFSAWLYLGAIGAPTLIGVAVFASVFFFLHYFLCTRGTSSAVLGVRAGWTMAVLLALCGIGAAIQALCFRDGPMQSAEAVALVFAEIYQIALAAVLVLSARRDSKSPSDDGPSNHGVETVRDA